jgi:hypothetical protein
VRLSVLSQVKLSGKIGIFLYMRRLDKYIHFYIGCNTNKGKLVGVRLDYLLIQVEGEQHITEYDTQLLGNNVFLYLQRLSDLNEEQSKELIKRGIAIGRPNGYTFSNEGFFYLISLNVDLFGLINSGYAKPFSSTA